MGIFLQKESWSFALLATSERRGGLYFVNFQMTGVWCAFVIPKRQKLSLNIWGGGQGVVFFHSSSLSLLPLFSFISCLPHFYPPFSHLLSPFSHLSPFFQTSLLSPTHRLPSPLIYVVMIVVNTIYTFVLLRDGNLISWWPSVIHVWSSKNVEKIVNPA